jgi:hypothetical protein
MAGKLGSALMWQNNQVDRLHVERNTLVGMNFLVILVDIPRVAVE